MRMNEMVDPRLIGDQVMQEVAHMIHVACQCVSPDPELRPRMSQVLRQLEDGMQSDSPSYQRSPTSPASKCDAYKLSPRTPTTLSRFNTSHQQFQNPNPNSRSSSTVSPQHPQTPPPISRYNDTAFQLCSQTPTPTISRSSDTAPTRRSQTPPISRYSYGTNDLGSQMPMSRTKSVRPLEESSVVKKIHGLHINETDYNNSMEPTQIREINTTGSKEMARSSNRKIINQDDLLTTQEYQAYLQESLHTFISKTRGSCNS